MVMVPRARVVGGGDASSSLAISFDADDDGGVFSAARAPSPPAFITVDLVLAASQSQIDALPHAVTLIKSFLDVSRVSSLAVAAANYPETCDAIEWLQRAVGRETRKLAGWSSELQRAYKQHQFATCANILAARGDVDALRWLRVFYYVKGKFEGVERAALWHGQQHVLRFLHAECFNRVADDATPLQDAIARAAAFGRADLVEWVVETKGEYAVGWGAMDAACAHDHMELVRYLFERIGNRCTRRGLELAALNGYLHVVMWLHERRYYEVRTFQTLENAVRGRHLEIVQFILRNVPVARHSWTQDARSAAIRYGQREILDWIDQFALSDDNSDEVDDEESEPKPYRLSSKALCDAARAGHVDVIQWLYEHGYLQDEARATVVLVRGAVDGGRQQVLKWVHDVYGHVLDNKRAAKQRLCVDDAARSGHIGLLPFLGKNNAFYHFTSDAMDDSAANGHFQVVKWLHNNTDSACTTAAMDQAAKNGHLDIVRFLHDHRKEGCTKAAMDGAARNGHLEIVRFLFENRGEYCSSAVAGDTYHVEVLEFLRVNGRLRNIPVEKWPSFEEAAKRGDLPLLLWLLQFAPSGRRQIARRSDRIMQAAREGRHFHVLRWLETLSSSYVAGWK